MARRRWLLLAIGAFGLAIALTIACRSNQPFARHVLSPVPSSVRVTLYQGSDWLGIDPEPVVYLGFSATLSDMTNLLAKAAFSAAATNAYVPVPDGPPGWKTADHCGPGRRLFTRNHPGRAGLRLGNRRSWMEYLWIDGTGTNAYFLLWGI